MYGCKVSPLEWSIFFGQNADLQAGATVLKYLTEDTFISIFSNPVSKRGKPEVAIFCVKSADGGERGRRWILVVTCHTIKVRGSENFISFLESWAISGRKLGMSY